MATRDDDGVDEVRYHSWRGHRVGYRTNGESGAAVVLIHGFGVSSYQFRENLEALGANHRVFALDLVGFGLECYIAKHIMLNVVVCISYNSTPHGPHCTIYIMCSM